MSIDGTTTGYQGTTGNWLNASINMMGQSMTFNDALAIAKSIKFTEGFSFPAKLLAEFEGLNPGESIDLVVEQPSGTNLRFDGSAK